MLSPEFSPSLQELEQPILKRGRKVSLRHEHGRLPAGSIVTIYRWWTADSGVWVRCNCGITASGKKLMQTLSLNVLADL